ncbi:hypothetical protein AX14_004430 [Amanita brunnescens Koide BX004]|nr:hypothetical protein AX14_004430 [Amanita brunnescens Koide BX004]
MSNPPYMNFLHNSYARRDLQRRRFSRSSAQSGMFAFPNGNAGAHYYLQNDSYGMSGHTTAVPPQSNISMQPGHAWINRNQAANDPYLSAGYQHTPPTVVMAQHLAKPTPHSTPVSPSGYTDAHIAAPSFMEISFPPLMQGPATSAPPPTLRHYPDYTKFRFNGSTRYRCECHYETHRKSDLDRHREGSKHAGKKYHCSFSKCTKSYTRKYKLEEHEKTHS